MEAVVLFLPKRPHLGCTGPKLAPTLPCGQSREGCLVALLRLTSYRHSDPGIFSDNLVRDRPGQVLTQR